MHTHYFYLRQVSAALGRALAGRQVDSAFSQDRDELVIGFLGAEDVFFVRVILQRTFVCLTFPAAFHRARKNSVELFETLHGHTVSGVVQYENDRSFALVFGGGTHRLLFKLHGNRANVLLYAGEQVVELFQHDIASDWQLVPETLHRPLHADFQTFAAAGGNPLAVYPMLGKPALAHLDAQGFSSLPPEARWERLQAFVNGLHHPESYWVSGAEAPGGPALTLWPVAEPAWQGADPLEAANRFYSLHAREHTFGREYGQLVQKLEKRRKQTENYLAKTYEKLVFLQTETRHEQLANLLMANLHAVAPGSDSVEVYDFYHDRPVRIKLKKELSPQKNAETYYRKAKNEKIEIGVLEKAIAHKETELQQIGQHLKSLSAVAELKALRLYAKTHGLVAEQAAPQFRELFKRYEFMGFEILVGKNAKNNDLLTREYAWKEDLWLHAKDVSGSHVVVKHQSGKPFPEPVIEKAAQLAAFYSKRKHDTLCPVTYTPRKYVRKPKGLPDGAVIVDKEQVVLVEPRDFKPEPAG